MDKGVVMAVEPSQKLLQQHLIIEWIIYKLYQRTSGGLDWFWQGWSRLVGVNSDPNDDVVTAGAD